MKRVIKNPIFTFAIGAILFSSITTVALTIASKDVSYDNTTSGSEKETVQDAIDDLYERLANAGSKFCKLKSGTALTVGAKYECDPGDGVKRNFFVLVVDTNKVKLIMEKNITQGMYWNDAMNYFKTGAGVSTKTAWTNVIDVDLPMAQDIANAGGITGWVASSSWSYFGVYSTSDTSKRSNYKWLYNYTLGCGDYGCDSSTSLSSPEAWGYWTRDLISKTAYAWVANRVGALTNSAIYNSDDGVRPVITVLKSNLY